MDIKDRIKLIMEREQLSSKVFADTIGVQQSTLSHVLSGRNNPSLDVVMKVHQAYSDVALEWLLYGKGELPASMDDAAKTQEPLLHANGAGFQPSLFDENPKISPKETSVAENRKENAVQTLENNLKEVVKQEIRYVEKPARKIKEIRIFFDDNTYETFRPEK